MLSPGPRTSLDEDAIVDEEATHHIAIGYGVAPAPTLLGHKLGDGLIDGPAGLGADEQIARVLLAQKATGYEIIG